MIFWHNLPEFTCIWLNCLAELRRENMAKFNHTKRIEAHGENISWTGLDCMRSHTIPVWWIELSLRGRWVRIFCDGCGGSVWEQGVYFSARIVFRHFHAAIVAQLVGNPQ